MESVFEREYSYYQVYFTKEDQRVVDLKFPLIRIFKHEENSQKNSKEGGYTFEVFNSSKEIIYESDFSLAFFEDSLDVFFSEMSQPVIASEKHEFFSMLDSSEDYRLIVGLLGVDNANDVLISLNDLVASREVSPQLKWLKEVESQQSFQIDFMQHYSKFFAFHNADSILRGLKEEKLDSMSNALHLEFELPSLESRFELDFNFDPDSNLPKRICVLIGENGLGKSQTLSHVARSLMHSKADLTEVGGSRPLVNKLLAIASPGETVNTFPSESKNSRIDYRRLLTSRARNAKTSQGFGEICVQLFRSQEDDVGIKGKSRWDIFLSFLDKFDNPFEICLQRQVSKENLDYSDGPIGVNNDEKYWPIMNMNMNRGDHQLKLLAELSNNLQPIRRLHGISTPLSSGQVTLLKFAAIACLHIENGTLVLLDEPETHLHPNYVSLFVELLDGLLIETGSLAIVATHSPYLVREVPRSQVKVFQRSEFRHVKITEPRLKTFGADIDSISHFVFGDEITNRLGENLIEMLSEHRGTTKGRQILEEVIKELPVEMEMYIRRRLGEG